MVENEKIRQRLIVLYREMVDHTRPECANTCRVPFSCCDPMYCGMAAEYAKEVWNVDLIPLKTDHPKLPFMGPSGCVVDPHLRPLCSFHTCQVNGLGFKPGDDAWNKRYFVLREEIDTLEWELEPESVDSED